MNNKLLCACIMGDIEYIKLILNDPKFNINYIGDVALEIVSRKGHVEIVKLFLTLPEINPADASHSAIITAARNNKMDVVKILSLWYVENGYEIDNIINIINSADFVFNSAELREYLEELNMIKYAGRK